MSDIVIRSEGLGKQYRIGSRERYKSLRDTVSEGVTGFFRRNGKSVDQRIWALRDVTFDVKKGEVLGIIGTNGTGKSTLLKILSRITEPTEGQVSIRGRVGSLLEVGTGFHPELSGRDNVYLSGAILGMNRREINRKFDEIVDFSGVSMFIDTPMKRYSSGMQVRLAFAIAAHLEPEIFLIDEVLAVGDMAFQEKCLNKMDEVASGGRTVLFVSHNMSAVRSFCSKAMMLQSGRIHTIGKPDEVIQAYTQYAEEQMMPGACCLADRKDRIGAGDVRVTSFEAAGPGGEAGLLRSCNQAEFIIGYKARENVSIPHLIAMIGITDISGVNVFSCTTAMSQLRSFRDIAPKGQIVCRVKSLPLLPGKYWVTAALKTDRGLEGVADQISRAGQFSVIDDGSSGLLVLPSGNSWGSVAVPHSWDWQPAGSELAPKT